MCQKEGASLQKGMNFHLKGRRSVILMSVRKNSPYRDEITKDGTVLIYEGHDVPKSSGVTNPKIIDQSEFRITGKLTENGKFHKAAQEYKKGAKSPDIVQVYEKIKPGIWSDNGVFRLTDSWIQSDENRNVFKFKLEIFDDAEDNSLPMDSSINGVRRSRLIPTIVKIEVWKRDAGRCVNCGANDELHFDHIVPYSKGGTSLEAKNIQLLCIRHNLEKSSKIL